MAAKSRKLQQTISIPKSNGFDQPRSASPTRYPKTPAPRTPADEAIEFFESGFKKDEPIRVYELALDPDGGPNKETQYIRLPPAYDPYILRVSLEAGTPASKNGVFKTNFPLDGGRFNRTRFCERWLPTDFSKPIQIDLPISHAGAFCYWIEYDGEGGTRIKGREGYFNIDPILRAKARAPVVAAGPSIAENAGAVQSDYVNIPLDGLSILTYVNKWMGPLANWREYFAEASERGYNMIHYPPLQHRGESNSPYSIADQLKYDPRMFTDSAEDKTALDEDGGKAKLEEILKMGREEFGLLSLTDVVLNHTANNTPWLADHPEAGYSPANTPHLTIVLELDNAMIEFSEALPKLGLPTVVKSEADVDTLMAAFEKYLEPRNFWEFYVFDVEAERQRVKSALEKGNVKSWPKNIQNKDVKQLAEVARYSGRLIGLGLPQKRGGPKVDPELSASIVKSAFVDLEDIDALADAWVRVVNVLNVPLYEIWKDDTKAAMDNIRGRLKYTRLDPHGPNLGPITKEEPITESYFTRVPGKYEEDPETFALIHNGWMWNTDPLKNFAVPPSKSYIRREVIAWGDCVKLRYGDGPSSNPWLWQHMTDYVVSLAQSFEGFRIDNCHSTPLHVGVHLMDAARVANPDLYICAELFTGSAESDILFVSRLGINSLIREAANVWDPKQLSDFLYRHGLGKPIGSMDGACLTSKEKLPPPTGKGPTRPCIVTPHNGSIPHALCYDLTHDNESYLDKRSAEDALSTAALVTFCWCAIGSVKGFDDLYPKYINIVKETRQYEITRLKENSGISKVKHILNNLHTEMALGGYTEGHVHEENGYIVMHRVEPTTQKGYLLVAHTAFQKGSKDRGYINPFKLRRSRAKFIYGAHLEFASYDARDDETTLRGMDGKLIEMAPVVVPQGLDEEGPYGEVVVPEFFPPGSIMLFETQLVGLDASLDDFCVSGADEAFGDLDLVDLNVVLHRADGEERDLTGGEVGTYNVPGMGSLVYCGLEGFMNPLRHMIRYNDLGHPLAAHLREGTWAFDFVWGRLEKQSKIFPKLEKPAKWLKERCERVKQGVPVFLRPKYFAMIVSEAYKAARRSAVEQMSEFVSEGHNFTQDLALVSVQLYGQVQSASLDPAGPVPSLAAGLPHFATSWARCWGRDVFISLRGLFLTTGQFLAAKKHIIAFASVVKHGLIPNLLDSLRTPRYNSRDSPWWMLQNIQDYTFSAPDGLAILSEPIKRRFPKDDTWVPWDDPRAFAETSTLAEIIQEILQRHADGIHFREYNAGPNLDSQMSDAGFNIDIEVDWKTGIIFGGNAHNCGTWMDKMGESERAGTKGVPGTPRDGAPVEITGLLKSTLRWLDQLASKGKFPFKGVEADIDGERRVVTYKEWSDLLQESFEKCYWVPTGPEDDSRYNIKSSLVNRRGIYKDVYGSGPGREWSDYQLRCNFPIAMVVAPELFDPQHALHALKVADKVLRAPLGMKTLDPSDFQYRPYYDNANDSDDPAIAKGRNYHQGPEWGWPLGYFLRAYLYFDTKVGAGADDPSQTLHYLHKLLLPSRRHIRNDPWRGIPELTNKDGSYCSDSCKTQAWSASCLLDFLEEVHKIPARP